MNMIKPTVFRPALLLAASACLIFAGCQKTYETNPSQQQDVLAKKSSSKKKIGHFDTVNLVSTDGSFGAAHTDPTLVNAWGIAFSSGGTPWVSSHDGHVSDIYNSEGVALGISPVHIPSPTGTQDGEPTGVVFSASATDFPLPTGGAARFIFAGEDGVISAWNGAQGHQAFRKLTVPSSAFTGLALANNGGTNFLYAANFKARKINVWDNNWAPVTTMPFTDHNIPMDYAPFNIQNIGGMLYVAYAKVDPATGDEDPGAGRGFVDIYRPDGTLAKRFAEHGTLNAPWGLTMAPAGFFDDGDDDHDDHKLQPAILVGNFGDGRINAYSTEGKFLGQLRGAKNQALIIDGLWALSFPPSTSTIDPNRLYFAAGPDDESKGLFGYIIKVMDNEE
ncbi:MAG: TIGR03118 family protein [Flavisolibacter sp.]